MHSRHHIAGAVTGGIAALLAVAWYFVPWRIGDEPSTQSRSQPQHPGPPASIVTTTQEHHDAYAASPIAERAWDAQAVAAVLQGHGSLEQAAVLMRRLHACQGLALHNLAQNQKACAQAQALSAEQQDQLAQRLAQSSNARHQVLLAQWVQRAKPGQQAWIALAQHGLRAAIAHSDGNALRVAAEYGTELGFTRIEALAMGQAYISRWGSRGLDGDELDDPRPLYASRARDSSPQTPQEAADIQALAWQLATQFPRRIVE